MRSGQLRHRVEVHSKTETANDTGEKVATWAKTADRWASIRPVSGKEGTHGGRIRETTTHEIKLRWVDGLTAENRVVFGSRTFEVESVLNFNEIGEFATLLCKENR